LAELTPEEIEAAVRRGCRGLPEAVVRLNVDEALREWERMVEDDKL